MNSELYTAASGLLVEQRRLDAISNNLANAATPGFRPQRLFARTFGAALADIPADVRAANAGVALGGAWEEAGPGPIRPTGRALDVALPADHLLVVQNGAGVGYTRSGSLSVDADGRLVDGAGRAMLDRRGEPLQGLLPAAAIDPDGSVRNGDAVVGRLAVVRAEPDTLVREGAGIYRAAAAAPQPVDEPQLLTASLEGSGTDALGELVRLIEAQRAFESYQRLISMTNDVNRRTVNDLARS